MSETAVMSSPLELSKPYEKEEIRDIIQAVEGNISELPGAMFGDCFPLKHTFADGVYVREIFIPQGALIVGKIHRHSHPNFLLSGDVSVLTEEGVKRMQGPVSMISPAGTKRVVYAHSDSVWVTVHATDETDLEKIEDVVIAKEYTDLLPSYIKNAVDVKAIAEQSEVI